MSTVHICLKDIFDVAVACHVIFYPEDTPFFSGSALAVSGAHSILIDADGTGSITLLPGRYTVRFAKITGNTDTLIILVPNEEGVYELQDLVCAGDWILPFRDFLQKSKNLADVSNPASAFAAIKQPATEAATGAVQLATQAEVDAGSDGAKAVTPATLAHLVKWAALNPQMVSVADSTERLALSAAEVHVGDLVEQLDTRAVYQVLDTTLLSHERGYVEVGTRPEGEATSTYGLQAEWLFAPGSELADTSGNSHHLSNTNGVTFEVAGGIAAAVFAGNDELVCAPLAPGSEVTITCKAKNNSSSGYVQVFGWAQLSTYTYHDSVGGPAWNYDYYGDPVRVGDTSDEWRFMTARFSDGLWTLTCDDASATLEAPIIDTASLSIGSQRFGGGKIAQFRIWNRVLSDAELAAVRTNGANPITS